MSKTKLALALLCVVALSAAGLVGCGGNETPTPSLDLPTGWSWQNPKPQGNSLNSVHFVSATVKAERHLQARTLPHNLEPLFVSGC